MKYIALTVVVVVTSLTSSFCHAVFPTIGIIKKVQGEVYLISAFTEIQAVSNMELIAGDQLITGIDGSIGLIFKDDTVAALGPSSQLEIEDFVFKPREQKLAFAVKMVRGTFSFKTGQIAKLAPQKVTLKTPNASLTARAAKFVVAVK